MKKITLVFVLVVIVAFAGYFIFSNKIVTNSYNQTSTNQTTPPVSNQSSTSQVKSFKPSSELPLTMARNTAFSDPTVSLGSVNQKIGSYTISSSNIQDINLTYISIITQKAPFPGEPTAFKNL